ncbi:MAG TPA: trypsin-like peptidase domain-containing protein [bacterium]|nr:trypsin-like peptidase domain-containing protein [bacterium]
MRTLFMLLCLATAPLAADNAPATNQPSPALLKAADDFSQVAEHADAWVVNISTTQYIRQRIGSFWEDFYGYDPFGGGGTRTLKRQSLGSGFILTADGEILTNAHVVEGADEVMVRLKDGTEAKAQVLGQDNNVDLALLKIHTDKPLVPATLGDSDGVRVGQWAIAIGNPFGFDHSLTVGVISAKERTNIFQGEGAAKYQNYLQTDASINHGNSGGPLCDIHGDVIGMNTAISTPNDGSIGIGFAIPINFIKRSIPDLRRLGKVVAPKLGFFTQDLDARLATALKLDRPEGVLVTDVAEGGPAALAGLKRGDVILAMNSKETPSSADLRTRIYEAQPGAALSLQIWRDGQAKTLTMTPAQLTATAAPQLWHGLTVVENNPTEASQRGLAVTQGVIVTSVAANSTADRIGMQAGDVLVELDQKRIIGMDGWTSLTHQATEDQDAVLLLVRNRQSAYIVIPAEP